MNKSITLHLSLFLFCLTAAACVEISEKNIQPPRAVKGIIDLRGWNHAKNGPLKLNGEWEFYWSRLIQPENFKNNTDLSPDGFINIPGAWNDFALNGEKLPGEGCATYRLRILLDEGSIPAALMILNINTAFEIFADGNLIGSAGTVNCRENEGRPEYFTGVLNFKASGPETEIIINVSNYSLVRGGVWEVLRFGEERKIRHAWDLVLSKDIFLFGSITIMCIYLLVFFLIIRRNRSSLYLGLFCAFITIFLIFTHGRFIIHLFPGLPWEISFRVICLSVFLSIPASAGFIRSLYPGEMSRGFYSSIALTGLIFSLSVFHPSSMFVSEALKHYQIVILIVLGFMSYFFVLAVLRKREGARITLFAAFVLFLFAVNDIFHDMEYYDEYFNLTLLPSGVFFFILSQVYNITLRFSSAFKSEERLMGELKNKTEELTAANINLDRDISLIKKAEKELEYTRNFLDRVINSISSVLVTVDSRSIVTQWNRAAENFTGIPSSEAVSMELSRAIPLLDSHHGRIRKVISSGIPDEHHEVKSGPAERKYFNIAIYPLSFEGMFGAVIRIDDVTALIKKDEQLRQAQKMETVGNLVSGISHDFNNALVGISGTASLINYQINSGRLNPEKLKEHICIIEQSAARAADMVKNLLSLSRKQDLRFEPVDLNQSLAAIIAICSGTFDKAVEIAVSYLPGKAMVKGDPGQIEQVLLNLCINSSHAMTIMRKTGEKPGGKLYAAVSGITADRHFCSMHAGVQPGIYICVSISDTGVGMDPETVSRVFEPFFTTKQKENGSGLGLTMVYNIVKAHGGFIDIYSEPEMGSAFNVYFPAFTDFDFFPEFSEKETDIHAGSGLILVIDDEEIMRRIVKRMLAECGYSAITAGDGGTGIEIFRERKNDIDAVILDMIMPGMSGAEIYNEIKKIKADVQVVLTSGFKQDSRVQSVIKSGVSAFIQKPFTINELGRVLKELFSESRKKDPD